MSTWEHFRFYVDGKPSDMMIFLLLAFGYAIHKLWPTAPRFINNLGFASFSIGLILIGANIVRPDYF